MTFTLDSWFSMMLWRVRFQVNVESTLLVSLRLNALLPSLKPAKPDTKLSAVGPRPM